MDMKIIANNSINHMEFSDIDLSGTLSSTHLSGSNNNNLENLTADKLLDELPLPQHHHLNYTNHNLSSPIKSNYDQFFEEVSLDLPRDSIQMNSSNSTSNNSSSRIMKFMPRRGNPPPSNSNPNTIILNTKSNSSNTKNSINTEGFNINSYRTENMAITPTDISGPFYSISDVLDDTKSSTPTLNRSISLTTNNNYSYHRQINPRAARRNVNEADMIATSGGSSIPMKGKSGLGIFRRSKSVSQKPSPLETAISKTRPRMLPPKDPQEERRHLQEYQTMMKKAKKLEAKKQKESIRRKEEKDKKMVHAINIWESDIIPHWKSKANDKKTIALWSQGLPPRCRKKVWALRIGNQLNITKGTFSECVRRVPQSIRTPTSTTSLNTIADLRGSTKPTPPSDNKKLNDMYNENQNNENSLYNLRRQRRTSSLDVLREQKEDRLGVPEAGDDDDQFVDVAISNHSASSYSLPNTRNDGHIDIYARNFAKNSSVNIRSTTNLKYDSHNVTNIDLDDDRGEEDSSSQEDDDDEDHDDKTLIDPTSISYLNKAIDEDILRTLPSLCVFQPDGPLFMSLRKVLHAYVGYRPNMTYSRGASFLAGVLLLNMNSHEAFTSLVNLVSTSQTLSALYNSDEKKIKGYFKIFNVIFAENLPKLYLHFKNLTLTPDNYLPDWFMTIFASIVPLDMSSKLWDIYLLYGDIILFRTGIVVLTYLEPLLWGSGFSETVKILNMGFVDEYRGEEVKSSSPINKYITEEGEDSFFDEILGRKGFYLDETRFNELMRVHMPH